MCWRETGVGEKMVSEGDNGALAEILRHSLIFASRNRSPWSWLQALSYGFPGVGFRNVYAADGGWPAGVQSALNGESRYVNVTGVAAGEQLVALMYATNEYGK